MAKLNEEMKTLIIFHLKNNKSQRKLSLELGISRSTIKSFWNKYRKTGIINDLPRCGRPTKTTPREQKKLIIMSKGNPTKTTYDLHRSWTTLQNVSI